jgi:DNA-directed RNA polymerase subunit RPC12/RpoP
MTTIWSFLDWKATWRARDSIRFSQYFFEPEIPQKKLETILMKCSACAGVFGVTAIENEMKIECPHCGKSGLVKMPKRPSGGSPDRLDDARRDRPDRPDRQSTRRGREEEPYVRIIKDIRND